ncbi:Cytochrome b-c1 complex subunit [Arachis hypogaea]|nr:Cytochrome b-c1 complex subunit [Arachis hypogaea]
MESASRRSGGGIFEALYKVLMRRNSVYVTFVIAGAFVGERVSLSFPSLQLQLWIMEFTSSGSTIMLG